MMNRMKAIIRRRFPIIPYAWKMIKNVPYLFSSSEKIFDSYYSSNTWGDEESVSGPGSNLDRTKAVRHHLPALLERHHVKSMLDVPCGDYHWMSTMDLDVSYVGGDIVEGLISDNRMKYEREGVRFVKLDLTRDNLPHSDIVLCRDCMVHLPFKDILKSVANIKRSGIEYLLATTFVDRDYNENIPTGDWRPINLERAPFNFSPPLDVINEECEEYDGAFRDKCLGLWRVADLPDA